MKAYDYVSELIDLNLKLFSKIPHNNPTFGVGFAEELCEWYLEHKAGTNKELNEIGDVLAYFSLFLFGNGYSIYLISTFIESSFITSSDYPEKFDYVHSLDFLFVVTKCLGKIKRCFRGEKNDYRETMEATLQFMFHVSGISREACETAFQKNIWKLESRFNRGLLDKGEGGSR